MRPARIALVQSAPAPRTAAECLKRLEDSRLYQRREIEANQSRTAAKLAALWYCEGLQ